MRQNPRVEPPSQLAPAIVLHPVLSDALVHLDIQLEEELARYRRQRTGNGRAMRQAGRPRSSESLELMALPATTNRRDAIQPNPGLQDRLTDVAEPSIAPNTYKPIPAFTASPQPFEGTIALRTAASPLPHNGNADGTPLGGDDASALAQAANPNLDDYLESSEELLRSLADEQAEVQAERHFMRSLLTPLGLGAMLLLLLSSAMFGYIIMNPSTLPWLTAKQNNNATGSPPAPNDGSIAAPQPDLAKRELPDLNLDNLGTVNVNPGIASSTAPGPSTAASTPSSKPTVAASTSVASTATPSQSSREPAASSQAPIPAATSSSSRPYTRLETPQVAPRSAPEPVAPPMRRVPTPASAAAASPTQNSSGGSGSYQYKVGIPFENDQTLEAARKVVPDAFVRTLPDGRTIVQMGAARNEAEGRANVQKLRDQGLSSTEVYKR